MEPLMVMSHNYQDGPTQEISDYIFGTGGIVRSAHEFKGKRVLFCGVLYMAEDLYNMADGKVEVLVPEITVKDGFIDRPRCPMIKKQRGSDIITLKHVEIARKLKPDVVLAYINTPSSVKAKCDGVYNGTVGLQVAERIAKERNGKGRVALIGDINLNAWIREVFKPRYPDFEIISVPSEGVQCPTHHNTSADFFKETYAQLKGIHGDDLGLEMHAEMNEEIRRFGFENGAHFGGSGGLVRIPKESDKKAWLVGTVEGVIDRLRRETDLAIYSVNMRCPNMSYTTAAKVKRAKAILSAGEPVADIGYTMWDQPYYEIEIHDEKSVKSVGKGAVSIPAVRLTVKGDISKAAKKALRTLL